ncbi:tRNA (adenosine(37)-N6)-threonylcarbamoyltransferase complex transferase subunit TsaD [Candidatus Marinamargulisbacteria bacterium SCGC AG-343-K17]|nr:tRNA (adenosine(37)-N6)-threonylcarbamoyltransferase complex transferase subunit TsaD [Candidatus Marinamargulisbacteria bacterium SCGC AG-343-K17]
MILAIETSCDETSVAILNGNQILSNVLYSQIKHHRKHGGVVPELASRLHAEKIDHILKQALIEADVQLSELTHIAVTVGPGLEGALLVGITAANMLAQSLQIPLVPVNHLHGHIYAAASDSALIYPSLICLASGGHTMIIYMKKNLQFEVVANTMDDACGECFDKVARMLDLGYPGGPKIEALAKEGSPTIQFPHPIKQKANAFSFSGLKTAVLTKVKDSDSNESADIAASIQHRIATVLSHKLNLSLESYDAKQLVLCGGVFANKYIRSHILSEVPLKNVLIPAPILCTDNAAMIGLAAVQYIEEGMVCDVITKCTPQLGLNFPELV